MPQTMDRRAGRAEEDGQQGFGGALQRETPRQGTTGRTGSKVPGSMRNSTQRAAFSNYDAWWGRGWSNQPFRNWGRTDPGPGSQSVPVPKERQETETC